MNKAQQEDKSVLVQDLRDGFYLFNAEGDTIHNPRPLKTQKSANQQAGKVFKKYPDINVIFVWEKQGDEWKKVSMLFTLVGKPKKRSIK